MLSNNERLLWSSVGIFYLYPTEEFFHHLVLMHSTSLSWWVVFCAEEYDSNRGKERERELHLNLLIPSSIYTIIWVWLEELSLKAGSSTLMRIISIFHHLECFYCSNLKEYSLDFGYLYNDSRSYWSIYIIVRSIWTGILSFNLGFRKLIIG